MCLFCVGWMLADPICSLFISVLITIRWAISYISFVQWFSSVRTLSVLHINKLFIFSNSVIPLLRDSVGILMQRIPTGLEKNLHIGYQRVRILILGI
jgi:Co/Zn/Cd efflux system component